MGGPDSVPEADGGEADAEGLFRDLRREVALPALQDAEEGRKVVLVGFELVEAFQVVVSGDDIVIDSVTLEVLSGVLEVF